MKHRFDGGANFTSVALSKCFSSASLPVVRKYHFLLAMFAWLGSFSCMASVQSPSREKIEPHMVMQATRPVVLVHGIWDNASKMTQMASYLRKQGLTVYTPTLAPSWGQVGLDVLAKQLSDYIDQHIGPNEKFDLVGFSMGGLICRYYLQRMDGLRRVDHFITLGTPHHGTVLAYGMLNAGCRQMRPDSAFIADLNSDFASLGKTKFTSIWTPFDLIIVPCTSSRVTVGRNTLWWVPLHPFLVWSPGCIRYVGSLLKS